MSSALPSLPQRRRSEDSRDSVGSSDNEDSQSPRYSKSASPENSYDDEVSRDSLSDFSSIRIGGADCDYADTNTLVSISAPDSGFLNNLRNPSRLVARDSNDTNGTSRKRTFTNSGPLQSSQGEKRTATKICRVCGDKAYSYNFNVITCESCKAFFRRNANKEKEIRCPFNENCDINIVSRRFCQRCRLQKCFKVGMKKEWIMSDEARLEKKQRIQDNRERRLAEKAQDEVRAQSQLGRSPIGLSAAMPAVRALSSSSEPALDQNVIHNARLLAAAAKAASADVSQQLAAAVAATQPVLLPQATVSTGPLNAVVSANPSSTANFVGAAPPAPLSAQIAAQAVQAFQNQVQEQIQQQAVHQMVAQQQQVAVVQAAQQIVAQQQHQQQQLAAAVAAAATVIGNGPVSVQNTADIVAQQQAVAALHTAALSPAQLNPVLTNPATLASLNGTDVVNDMVPMVNAAVPADELVTVPKTVLMKLVEDKLESTTNNATQPPLKCQCRCHCGRYPSEMLIVDKVMTDLLNSSAESNNKPELCKPEAMETDDCEFALLDKADTDLLNEILQANIYWCSDSPVEASSATDVALRRLIRMMSRVEAFRRLTRVDQSTLLKHGCASHFAIRSAMTMNENNWQHNQLLSDTVVRFFNSLKPEWRSNENIMLLLSVLVIFEPATPLLLDRRLVQSQKQHLQRVLKRIVFTLCGQDLGRSRSNYAEICETLAILRSLNEATLSNASQGGVSVCSWSTEVVEPLLSRELFESAQTGAMTAQQ